MSVKTTGQGSALAQALQVDKETIRDFNPEAVINNNIHDQNNTVINYNFNPIDKIVELYEQLLESERKRSELLEHILKEKKS